MAEVLPAAKAAYVARLAALGYLNPVIAGAAMALSSVSVVSNSLLLRRWRPSAGSIADRGSR